MEIYKTWEVIKMLTENKELIFKSISCGTCLSIIHTNFISSKNKEHARMDIDINDRWTLIEQSVIFDEVLKNNKKCRVEHELINKCNFIGGELEGLKEFNELDCIMCILSCRLDSESLKTIIREGKWYLE